MSNFSTGFHNNCIDDKNDDFYGENNIVHALEIVIIVLYIVLGLVGNITIICVYYGSYREKTKEYKHFIIILAVIDLVSCCLFAILKFSSFLDLNTDLLCKILPYSCHTAASLSALVVTLIGHQRFNLICRPLQQQTTSRDRYRRLCVCCSFAAIISAPYLIFNGAADDQYCDNIVMTKCLILDKFAGSSIFISYNALLVLLTAIIIFAILTFYLAVLCDVQKRQKFLDRKIKKAKLDFNKIRRRVHKQFFAEEYTCTSSNDVNQSMLSLNVILCQGISSPQKKKKQDDKTKEVCVPKTGKQQVLTCMFFTITMLCIVAYVPRRIIDLLACINKDVESLRNERFEDRFLKNLFIVHSVFNPYIYGMFDRDLRRRVKKIFKDWKSSKK